MVDIHALQEKGTDELRIGTIRDGLADLLFPGTGNRSEESAIFHFHPLDLPRVRRQGDIFSRCYRKRQVS